MADIKTLEQLQEELVKLQGEHFEARKSHKQGDLVNPHILTTKRKEIARTLTHIGQVIRESQKEENK